MSATARTPEQRRPLRSVEVGALCPRMVIQKAHYAVAAFALFGCSPSFPSPEDFGDIADEVADESSDEGPAAYPDAGGPECDSAADEGDGRRGITDVECFDGECSARWVGAQERSVVARLEELEAFEIDLDIAAEVWPCDPAPDLDACYVIDQVGHYVCGRVECDYLVVVVPVCAVPTLTGWVDAGNGMVSQSI